MQNKDVDSRQPECNEESQPEVDSAGPSTYFPSTVNGALSKLLLHSNDLILENWLGRVRQDPLIPKTEHLKRFVLIDHMPQILKRITTAMSGSEAGRLKVEEAVKFVGNMAAIKSHSEIRFDEGFSLTEVLREFGHLRATIVELWLNSGIKPAPNELLILHSSIDEIIIAAADELASYTSQAREVVIAKIAHEISLPLTVMFGQIDMLSRSYLQKDRFERYVTAMSHNARVMRQTVVDLMNFSNIVKVGFQLTLSSCNALAITTAAYEAVRDAADEKGISIDIDLDPEIHTFIADPIRG
jgi:signal transduction histidine kinase